MTRNSDDFTQSLSFFHIASGATYINEAELDRMGQELGICTELSLSFGGLAWELTSQEPQRFWNSDAAEEVHQRLSELYATDSAQLSSALDAAQEHCFAGISAFDSAVSVQRELSTVSYEESLKTKILRNPLYVQLCEDCLMNIYRGLRCVVQDFRPDKDYSKLDTLGQLIPALQTNGFPVVCGVDFGLRNAINHGNAVPQGSDVYFKYKSNSGYTVRKMSVWEYQDVIDETMDLATGAIVGLVRFLSEHPVLTERLFSAAPDDIRFEWFKLFFRAPETRLLLAQRSVVGTRQIGMRAQSTIPDRDRLLMALIQIIRAAYVIFPDYERYLVGYQHGRCPPGFVRLDRATLQATSDTEQLLQVAIRSGEILQFPIQSDDVDEQAFRFHVFPAVSGDGWVVRGIEDCSIEGYKRIKAQLLLDRHESRETIRKFVTGAIESIRTLRTPKNPREPVPFGDMEADIVFLNVFVRARKRKSFALLPNNPNFMCMGHYYASDEAPRVKHGGVPEVIWNQFEQQKDETIAFIWNPNVSA